MASLTGRAAVNRGQSAANKPIIKKRSAIPTMRPALGTLKNRASSNEETTKETAGRKVLTTRQTNVTKSVQNGKIRNSSKDVEKTSAPAKACVERAIERVPDSPLHMVIGTPQKDVVNSFQIRPAGVDDIDANDSENPQLCSEFVNDIYNYMLYVESLHPIRQHYFKDSGMNLKSKMRSILVDWLIQVHHRFELLQETLYLTIAILDRFLQINPVPRTELQLVGVTAMLIAAKYEEMYAPEVSDYVYITDQAFSKAQILSMEVKVLKVLEFNLGKPLHLHFLRRDSKAGQVDASQHTLAKYLMELTLVDYDMCHIPPSKIAASCLCLSIKLLQNAEWSKTLQHYSTYSEDDLLPIVQHIAKNLNGASSNQYQQAVVAKYRSTKLMKISQHSKLQTGIVSELAEKAKDDDL